MGLLRQSHEMLFLCCLLLYRRAAQIGPIDRRIQLLAANLAASHTFDLWAVLWRDAPTAAPILYRLVGDTELAGHVAERGKFADGLRNDVFHGERQIG